MKNPFLDRAAKRGGSGHGNASEQRLGKSLRAQLIAGSGNIKGNKGDLKYNADRQWLVEAKSTVHDTLSLKLEHLVKISYEALAVGKVPALTVSFVTPEGKPRPKGDWVCIPLELYKELTCSS